MHVCIASAIRCSNSGTSDGSGLHGSPWGSHFLDQTDEVTILDDLDLVGENHKEPIHLIELAALELVAEFLASQSQRMPAGVFAKHEHGAGHAN